MKVSDRGITLIQAFEGLATQVYDDIAGHATIGYGHMLKSGERYTRITDAEATELLCRDLEDAEACLEAYVDVPLSQNQFDSLASFVFNLGCTRFASSTLLRKLNAGDYAGAAAEFPKWCKVGQNQVDGLLRRRLAEQALFNIPDGPKPFITVTRTDPFKPGA